MLDQKDLEQIGKVVETVVDTKLKASEGRIIVAVGEMLEQQVLPQIGSLETKVVGLERRMDSLEGKVDSLEGKVANLPDKDYLDRKLAYPEGERTAKLRKVNEKVDVVIDTLQAKGTFSKDEARHIQQKFQIFPAV